MGKIIIDITDSDYQSCSTYKLSTSASFSSCSSSASYSYVINLKLITRNNYSSHLILTMEFFLSFINKAIVTVIKLIPNLYQLVLGLNQEQCHLNVQANAFYRKQRR